MEFTKHDFKKLKRVGSSWRKPTGKKNKTKVGKKGHKKMPSKGFKSNSSKRGMIAGKIPFRVLSLSDVDKLKGKLIYEKCKEKKIAVINYAGKAKDTEKNSK
jgi:ribosomal protein L32E